MAAQSSRAFAVYRLPHASECTLVEQVEGSPCCLPSVEQLSGRSGFVVAPFHAGAGAPVVLIRPDRLQQFPASAPAPEMQAAKMQAAKPPATVPGGFAAGGISGFAAGAAPSFAAGAAPGFAAYSRDFASFHRAIAAGRFSKLVLARSAEEPAVPADSHLQLFHRACQLYPRLFVALVSTPQSGIWLTATPEILLEGHDGTWRTSALAGTMRLTGDDLNSEGERLLWSVKDIREQHYVASYIADTLRSLGITFTEDGPRTVRAANLVHLRTDFTFALPQEQDASPIYNKCTRVGSLLAALYPTPAVCGLPKAGALRFILSNEHTSRRYYSGFMGPVGIDSGQGLSTHLYVTLRCMELCPDVCRLYAGGGLLAESTLQKEWQETEAKLQTMRQLLYV
ncbi:MAG: chorismate-binding protein [Prevotella sp.]|nr:chorismate-binding protein [Prevotella sp.]